MKDCATYIKRGSERASTISGVRARFLVIRVCSHHAAARNKHWRARAAARNAPLRVLHARRSALGYTRTAPYAHVYARS